MERHFTRKGTFLQMQCNLLEDSTEFKIYRLLFRRFKCVLNVKTSYKVLILFQKFLKSGLENSSSILQN